jgi:hypothetical protein
MVLENKGLSKAAGCMQKFHAVTVEGKGTVFSTSATKHTGEMELSFTSVLSGSEW